MCNIVLGPKLLRLLALLQHPLAPVTVYDRRRPTRKDHLKSPFPPVILADSPLVSIPLSREEKSPFSIPVGVVRPTIRVIVPPIRRDQTPMSRITAPPGISYPEDAPPPPTSTTYVHYDVTQASGLYHAVPRTQSRPMIDISEGSSNAAGTAALAVGMCITIAAVSMYKALAPRRRPQRTRLPVSEQTQVAHDASSDVVSDDTFTLDVDRTLVEDEQKDEVGSGDGLVKRMEALARSQGNKGLDASIWASTASPVQSIAVDGLSASMWAPKAPSAARLDDIVAKTSPGLEASIWAPKSRSTARPTPVVARRNPKAQRPARLDNTAAQRSSGLEASIPKARPSSSQEVPVPALESSARAHQVSSIARSVQVAVERSSGPGLEASIWAPKTLSITHSVKLDLETYEGVGLSASIWAPKILSITRSNKLDLETYEGAGLSASIWAPQVASISTKPTVPASAHRTSGLEASIWAPSNRGLTDVTNVQVALDVVLHTVPSSRRPHKRRDHGRR